MGRVYIYTRVHCAWYVFMYDAYTCHDTKKKKDETENYIVFTGTRARSSSWGWMSVAYASGGFVKRGANSQVGGEQGGVGGGGAGRHIYV